VTFTFSASLIAFVQGWLDDPASNHGWILLGDEVFMQNASRILSREHTGPGNPLLILEFTPPPPTAVPVMTTTGLLVLLIFLLYLSGLYLRKHPKKIRKLYGTYIP